MQHCRSVASPWRRNRRAPFPSREPRRGPATTVRRIVRAKRSHRRMARPQRSRRRTARPQRSRRRTARTQRSRRRTAHQGRPPPPASGPHPTPGRPVAPPGRSAGAAPDRPPGTRPHRPRQVWRPPLWVDPGRAHPGLPGAPTRGHASRAARCEWLREPGRVPATRSQEAPAPSPAPADATAHAQATLPTGPCPSGRQSDRRRAARPAPPARRPAAAGARRAGADGGCRDARPRGVRRPGRGRAGAAATSRVPPRRPTRTLRHGGDEPMAHLIMAEQAEREGGSSTPAACHAWSSSVSARASSGCSPGEPRSTVWPSAPRRGWTRRRRCRAASGCSSAARRSPIPTPGRGRRRSSHDGDGRGRATGRECRGAVPHRGCRTPASCRHGCHTDPAPRGESRSGPSSLELAERDLARGDLPALVDRLAVLLRLDPALAPVILSIVAASHPHRPTAPEAAVGTEPPDTAIAPDAARRYLPGPRPRDRGRRRLSGSPPGPARARRHQGAHVSERTLILIKPDGVQRLLVGRIIDRYEQRGLRIVGLKLMRADRALAERHYAVHAEQAVLRRPRGLHHLGAARGPRRRGHERGGRVPRHQRRHATARGRARLASAATSRSRRAEPRPRLRQPRERGPGAGALVRGRRAARLRARRRRLGRAER